jgi:hypothetical protein
MYKFIAQPKITYDNDKNEIDISLCISKQKATTTATTTQTHLLIISKNYYAVNLYNTHLDWIYIFNIKNSG